MMVIDNVMYFIIYFYVNINVSLETFVVLISYICGIVLVELKLLQVVCNGTMVLNPRKKIQPIAAGKKRR